MTLSTTVPLSGPLDLAATLTPLSMGPGDPTCRTDPDETWWWATRGPEGPVTVHVGVDGDALHLETWGPGARWATAAALDLVGADDDPVAATAAHAAAAAVVARHPGGRVGRTGRVLDAVVAALCRRGASSFEAGRSWSLLTEELGDDAPGPGDLRLPPPAGRLASASAYDLHVVGLERDVADDLRRLAPHAARIDDDGPLPRRVLVRRLRALPGAGTDVVAHVRAVALGDPDAVPSLDGHTAALVTRALEPATDPGPVDLDGALAPFRPHRGRVVRLVASSASGRSRAGGLGGR